VVATIAVGPQPNGVAVTPNGERIYVSNFQADTVSVIDAAARAVVDTITVGEEPVGIAVSPDGTRVYVANRGSSTVSVIDSATDQLVATVDSGVGPGSNGIALSPDGTRAYVNNAFSRDPGTVSVIDTAAATAIGTIDVARNPKRVAIAPDGLTGYVANFRSWNISIICRPTRCAMHCVSPAAPSVSPCIPTGSTPTSPTSTEPSRYSRLRTACSPFRLPSAASHTRLRCRVRAGRRTSRTWRTIRSRSSTSAPTSR
jgi:YVTN family beta-propeller protein